ncbi:MAG: hypothetical protein ACK5MA_05685 [Parachlamydiaceae bacterium]
MSQPLAPKNAFLLVFALYFLPIFSWILWTYLQMPYELSLAVFLGGCALLCVGSALLLAFLKSALQKQEVLAPVQGFLPKEVAPEKIVERVVVDNSEQYLEQIDALKEQLIEKEHLLSEAQSAFQEIKLSHDDMETLVRQLESERLRKEQELGNKAEELELQSIQKQQMVEQLESQIHDLRYEIKTLLQLTEVDYSKFVMEQPVKKAELDDELPRVQGNVKREEEARILLRRCLDVAQKITFPTRPMQASSGEVSALDLRRLTDAMKEESGALVLFYNPKEKKVLYASREAKPLLGYAPETLAHQFAEVAEEGLPFWEAAVGQLTSKPQSSLVLGLKTRAGEEIVFNVQLGAVASGGFKGYAVAVFYPQ